MKNSMNIRIDPGLFEWMAWYPDEMPEWCTGQELIAANYNIDLNYVPTMTAKDLQASVKESCEEFYHRNQLVVENILNDNRKLILFYCVITDRKS